MGFVPIPLIDLVNQYIQKSEPLKSVDMPIEKTKEIINPTSTSGYVGERPTREERR